MRFVCFGRGIFDSEESPNAPPTCPHVHQPTCSHSRFEWSRYDDEDDEDDDNHHVYDNTFRDGLPVKGTSADGSFYVRWSIRHAGLLSSILLLFFV